MAAGPSHEVHYYVADWSHAELTEIVGELDARGIEHRIEGDDLWVPRRHERAVDMLVESVTEE